MKIKTIVALCIAYALSSCSNKKNETVSQEEQTETAKAQVWVTNAEKTKLLQQSTLFTYAETSTNTSGLKIDLNNSQSLQEIEGFGAALTGSSAYLINKKLSNTQRENLLEELFNPEKGIGINYIRVTMGASDFSLEDFTYNDIAPGKTDPTLAGFSIEKDKADLIPVLKQILAINPNIKIMATPWSPPAWMKTNGKLAGGKLKPEWYEVYANYFVKYLRAYQAEGIEIDAISVQNEPLHEAAYPSLLMLANEQLDFIKNHLGPLFEKEKIKTKILAYDHNWDRPDYPLTILDDPTAKKYVAGSAFHAYGGDVTAMTKVHDAHPDKGLYFTEISGGAWATNFGDNMAWNMKNIFIGTTRNWSKNALLWNLALDPQYGPTNNGCSNCRGVVTINTDGSILRNEEYYTLGHMSKFIQTGAKRVFTEPISGIEQVAFKNPDGSLVVVVLNDSSESKRIVISQGNNNLICNQEPRSTYTYTIKP